ncbi:MAG: hypothetical protein KAT34_03105 [Candidatus Aminicenantes bacterium]|nr:hypothetical protein [Candidatus Aminicenantes bacterium]
MGSFKKWYPKFAFLNGFASSLDIFGMNSMNWEELQSIISVKRRNEAIHKYFRNALKGIDEEIKKIEEVRR